MLTNLLPFIYFVVVTLLLLQALRVIFQSFASANSTVKHTSSSREDRTGLLTVHPELLNKEGRITDEDLLTVRFTNDLDPPKSAEASSDE